MSGDRRSFGRTGQGLPLCQHKVDGEECGRVACVSLANVDGVEGNERAFCGQHYKEWYEAKKQFETIINR
jgi:hypothetical protein